MCHTQESKWKKTVIFSTKNGVLTKFSDSHDQTWYTNPQTHKPTKYEYKSICNKWKKKQVWVLRTLERIMINNN